MALGLTQGVVQQPGAGQDGPRLALETLTEFDIAGQMLGQHLDGDSAVELSVVREIDLPHPARAEQADDLVAAEPGAGGEGHQLLSSPISAVTE